MAPGPKPKKIIDETWSSNLAYTIGLLATDGCLSKVGHLIDFTSMDVEQLENYKTCLNINTPIGKKSSSKGRVAFRVQFKNVIFYDFLIDLGLTPAKSLTLGPLKIPNEYFFDFLRGCLDGDGYVYSYWDPRWKSSFMFYLGFTSASLSFISWIRGKIQKKLKIEGHVTSAKKINIYYQLKYAKSESIRIFHEMYQDKKCISLTRKRLKIAKILSIVGRQLP